MTESKSLGPSSKAGLVETARSFREAKFLDEAKRCLVRAAYIEPGSLEVEQELKELRRALDIASREGFWRRVASHPWSTPVLAAIASLLVVTLGGQYLLWQKAELDQKIEIQGSIATTLTEFLQTISRINELKVERLRAQQEIDKRDRVVLTLPVGSGRFQVAMERAKDARTRVAKLDEAIDALEAKRIPIEAKIGSIITSVSTYFGDDPASAAKDWFDKYRALLGSRKEIKIEESGLIDLSQNLVQNVNKEVRFQLKHFWSRLLRIGGQG